MKKKTFHIKINIKQSIPIFYILKKEEYEKNNLQCYFDEDKKNSNCPYKYFVDKLYHVSLPRLSQLLARNIGAS